MQFNQSGYKDGMQIPNQLQFAFVTMGIVRSKRVAKKLPATLKTLAHEATARQFDSRFS